MEKMNCPVCGKELVKLNTGEKKKHDFWCDDCNIDITIEENEE